MELQNNLDTIGSLQINTLAELFAEIAQNQLNGSLRVANAAQKTAVYFDAGELVFAVSNQRQHRLFETLLENGGPFTREQITAITDYTNDAALRENLLSRKMLEKKQIEQLSLRQISTILKAALDWRTGDWTFSPLVRIKGDVRHRIDWRNLLVEHAREFPAEEITRKFNNPQERFSAKSALTAAVNLSPPESFVFSRFETQSLTIEAIQTLSGLPEAETRRVLYALWLGGLIVRENWSAAFSERKVAAILSARLSLKKDAPPPVIQPVAVPGAPLSVETETIESGEKAAPIENQIPLEEYLKRVEQATNFYEIFAVPPKAAAAEIKQKYFALAKRFHPDLFHKESDLELLRRVESAFTRLAYAYDTLKTESSREVYDFKMRKELAESEHMRDTNTTPEAANLQKQIDHAAESFELGFGLLMDGNPEAAAVPLSRAVHFVKDNARYRAYYGKALAANSKTRHQAEAELQAAVKLDHRNAGYRIMLAEFFMQVGLRKRAEGELNRLLTIFPNHLEAKTLLDSLPKNS